MSRLTVDQALQLAVNYHQANRLTEAEAIYRQVLLVLPEHPEALHLLGVVTGQQAKHNDIDREAWIDGSVAAGVPAEYGETLRRLTETIASGHGSRPTSDVQNVTGVPPTSFADFARRTAHAWARQGA